LSGRGQRSNALLIFWERSNLQQAFPARAIFSAIQREGWSIYLLEKNQAFVPWIWAGNVAKKSSVPLMFSGQLSELSDFHPETSAM